MSIPGAGNPLLLGGAAGGYKIERSLRFNSADSAYLSRTPASASNRKTLTWSGWVKRASGSDATIIFGVLTAATHYNRLYWYFDKLYCDFYNPTLAFSLGTVALFRDYAAWYHIVLTVDTTQATAANRVQIYINGLQQTLTGTYPTQNTDTLFNSTEPHFIGTDSAGSYSNKYLADVHFINGQALTPSSFGEFDDNGIWQPIKYAGSYGTNGFQLKFADNSAATATTLGKDTSGNGNNWTPNNLSVTAGAGNDSLVDSPTNYGTDTGAGGEVRGNYCTWNPLTASITGATLSNGNLDLQTPVTNYGLTHGTIGVSSGKWYWEIRINSLGDALIGIDSRSITASNLYLGAGISYSYTNSGTKYGPNDASASYGATYTSNDVIGVALDLDAGTLSFYKNGTSQGQAFSGIAGTFVPAFSDGSASTVAGANVTANFGQRPFSYTAPSGFKALCTQNLPAPTITKPSTVMDVKLYTGNGSTQTISGLGFSPDLVWIKNRSSVFNHGLFDTIRGAGNALYSSLNFAETAESGVSAFTADGFSVGSSSGFNQSLAAIVAWTWDAGSSTVTNTAGTISSQVRANASAGFSVVTGTAPSSAIAFTYGHGLNVKPSLVIFKDRDNGNSWCVHHSSVCITKDDALFLNGTGGVGAYSNIFGSALPTSSVAGAYVGVTCNASAKFVAYCFAPVAGYSAFGSYTGNGSADGPFVYTGFRPRYIMVKSSSNGGTGYDWIIKDTERDAINTVTNFLITNGAQQENYRGDGTLIADLYFDFLSNGFKVRTNRAAVNGSATTYIYAAFAEAPFALARAR